MTISRIDPTNETPVQTAEHERYTLRYAYARSADSQKSKDTGQDFLTFAVEANEVLFVLCDGVSQSFYGDFAAQFLADALLGWLSTQTGDPKMGPCGQLARQLRNLTPEATKQLPELDLDPETPAMLKEVLEKKRTLGSESTFACGKIALPGADSTEGRLFLAWMGDSRIRLWTKGGESTELLGDVFETSQRWSTRQGPVFGEPNCFISTLAGVERIAVYSDGLKSLDTIAQPPDVDGLQTLVDSAIESPESDDIAYFELTVHDPTAVPVDLFTPGPPDRVAATTRDGKRIVAWDHSENVRFWQVQVDNDRSWTWQAATNEWEIPAFIQGQSVRARVRAVHGFAPGPWGEWVLLPALSADTVMTRQSEITPRDPRKPTWSTPWSVPLLIMLIAGCIVAGVYAPDRIRTVLAPVPTDAPVDSPFPARTQPVALESPTPMVLETGITELVVNGSDSQQTPSPTPTAVSTIMAAAPTPTLQPTPTLEATLVTCYVVLPIQGLRFRSSPAGELIGVFVVGDQLAATSNTRTAALEGIAYIWIEVQAGEKIGWSAWRSEDGRYVFLEPCS